MDQRGKTCALLMRWRARPIHCRLCFSESVDWCIECSRQSDIGVATRDGDFECQLYYISLYLAGSARVEYSLFICIFVYFELVEQLQ